MKRFLLSGLVAAALCSAAEVSFTRDVQPILVARCQPCHQAEALGANGARVLRMVSGENPAMPKVGPPLKLAEVKLISEWVAAGAKRDEAWWSLKPLAKVTVPAAGHPLDAFVVAKLRSMNLTPSAEADRRTLIRRLSYDLHGLPPSLAETASFINDKSPEAYEKLVDRLLADRKSTRLNSSHRH